MEDRIIEQILDSGEGFRVRICPPNALNKTSLVLLEKYSKRENGWYQIRDANLPSIQDYSRSEMQVLMSRICALELENKVLKEMIVAKGQ